MKRKKRYNNVDEWKKICSEIHNNKYNYDKVEYVNAHTNVIITCPIHGDFPQLPNNHIKGFGCKYCNGVRTNEQFIKDAKKIHGNKYDYSKTDVNNCDENGKVIITCPIHGEFKQTPNNHLHGKGCSKCKGNNKLTTEEVIKRAKEVHGDKYDYSKLVYVNYDTPFIIICPVHGEVETTYDSHIRLKHKCKYCSHRSFKYTTEEWIEKARNVHGDRYDYSKVNYKGKDKNVTIICPIHGEFSQIASDHVNNKSGCPICNESKLEIEIRKILNDNNIDFEAQKKFEWLGRQSLNFYLPKYNIAIECQGKQHYDLVDFGGKGIEWSMEHLKQTQKLDIKKLNLCEEHNIKIFYYSNKKYNENIITTPKKIIEKILI